MDNNKYFLPGAVIIAGALIAGAVVWNGSHPSGPAGPRADGRTLSAVNINDIKTAGDPFLGNADAPITIAFWSDFQCPFCKQFEVGGVPELTQGGITTAFPDVVKTYVDTGKAKVVFMDFAFLGDDSITAAAYGRAVWKLYPEHYFAWRTAMYTAQDDEGDKGFGDAASINALTAKIAGIDAVKVAADVTANKTAYDAAAAADKAEATRAGVNGTPAFVIGNEFINGAQTFSAFQKAIEDPIKK